MVWDVHRSNAEAEDKCIAFQLGRIMENRGVKKDVRCAKNAAGQEQDDLRVTLAGVSSSRKVAKM